MDLVLRIHRELGLHVLKVGMFFQYLKSCLVKELDFEHEARNMERCAQDLKHLRFVYVPKVQWPETSKVGK